MRSKLRASLFVVAIAGLAAVLIAPSLQAPETADAASARANLRQFPQGFAEGR
jgi:hypothetical protein